MAELEQVEKVLGNECSLAAPWLVVFRVTGHAGGTDIGFADAKPKLHGRPVSTARSSPDHPRSTSASPIAPPMDMTAGGVGPEPTALPALPASIRTDAVASFRRSYGDAQKHEQA